MILRPSALLALVLAGTGLADAAPRRDAWRDAVPAGKPLSCIPIRSIRESRVRDDRTIDFYMNGRTVYRSTLPGSCPGLGFEQRFAYATSLSRLCSTDIITVFTTAPAMRGASCGLGAFQPVTGLAR